MMGWLPVFFLYFNQYVTLSQTIQLGAIYYFSVCFWEIPSGYFSDRFGRRLILILAGCALVVSYSVFLLATGFFGLALGQFLLALGIAMMSGSDTAFLYDSLLSDGRQEEYADFEAKAQKYGFAAVTFASLAGGFLGLIDLRLAYLLSLIGAVVMVVIALRFVEPDIAEQTEKPPLSLFASVFACLSLLKNKVLLWIFGVMSLMYSLEHIVFEFYQPYVKLLKIDWLDSGSASMVSGIVIAISMFGGTLGAAYSVRIFRRIGVKAILFIAFAFQLTIVGGLSVYLAPLLLILVMFRNFPMALIHAPVNATIAPRVDSQLRATYLSIQSLSARLVLSLFLYFLSMRLDPSLPLDWNALSDVLKTSLLFGVGLVLVTIVFAPTIKLISESEK